METEATLSRSGFFRRIVIFTAGVTLLLIFVSVLAVVTLIYHWNTSLSPPLEGERILEEQRKAQPVPFGQDLEDRR